MRVVKKLKTAGVEDRADLLARCDDLSVLGLSDYDIRLVRRRLGWKPAVEVAAVEAIGDLPGAGDRAGPEQVSATIVGPDLWTTRQVAEYLHLTRRTVANWCGTGRVKAVKPGEDWRVPRAEVQRLARGGG